jgi:hypothetical protein
MHKLTDEIFTTIAISPNQPNHSFAVALDWSGSMDDSILGLTEHVIELVEFAHLANVELEVFLFTTNPSVTRIDDDFAKRNDSVAWMNSTFINVVNTKRHSLLQSRKRIEALFNASYMNVSKEKDILWTLSMQGTNIVEALRYGHGLLERMSGSKKSLFFLTDGEDNDVFSDIIHDGFHSKTCIKEGDVVIDGAVIDKMQGLSARSCAMLAITALSKTVLSHKTIPIIWGNETLESSLGIPALHTGESTNENLFIKQIINQIL